MQLLNQLRRAVSDQMEKRQILRGLINKNDRAGMQFKAWGHVFTNLMRGEYAEFGVYKGDSLVNSYESYLLFVKWLEGELKSEEKWRRKVVEKYADFSPTFQGLDTFRGMPDNNENSANFEGGTFQTSYESVSKKCAGIGLEAPRLVLHKGLFEDSRDSFQKAMSGKKLAILNVDCDLQSSAVTALDMAEPYFQIGTVVLFDDYNSFCADNTQGERKAFADFCKKSSFIFEPWQSYHFVGQSFLCVGKR